MAMKIVILTINYSGLSVPAGGILALTQVHTSVLPLTGEQPAGNDPLGRLRIPEKGPWSSRWGDSFSN